MLYIVATPIGNLDDLSIRAAQILQKTKLIIAENPAYSNRLFKAIAGLPKISSEDADFEDENKKDFFQFAEHNEQQVVKDLCRRLAKEDGCLITDAGTPGISDPGFRLVRECIKEKVPVCPLPGPNAAITALSASGLPTDRFLFLGFLQKTAFKVVEAMETAHKAEATAIFYESPQRIQKTLSYIANAFPTCQVTVARELTKLHEEFLRGNVSEVLHEINLRQNLKGELTVLISFK